MSDTPRTALLIDDYGWVDGWSDSHRQLECELAAAQTKYDELIYQVGTKWPNETRHETALRYIKRYENNLGDLSAKADAAVAAKVK